MILARVLFGQVSGYSFFPPSENFVVVLCYVKQGRYE